MDDLLELDVVILPKSRSIGAAAPSDFTRVRVLAPNAFAARFDPAVQRRTGSYIVGVAQPGEELAEERAARQRQIEAGVDDKERHDPIERAWPSFPGAT